MTLQQWQATFLPIELGPDYQPRPSQCNMYQVDDETLPAFLSGELPGNKTDLETVACKELTGWTYDQRFVKAPLFIFENI